MDPTFERNAGAEERPARAFHKPTPDLSLRDPKWSLDVLVRAWGERSADVPIAIVVSIFDDVLASVVLGASALELGDVVVAASGRARVERRVDLAALASVLAGVLGAHEAPPPQVLSMLAKLDDGPRDPEELRAWLREALGPPATHDEVAAAFRHLRSEPSTTGRAVPEGFEADEPIPLAELAEEPSEGRDAASTQGEDSSPPDEDADTSAIASALAGSSAHDEAEACDSTPTDVPAPRADFELRILTAIPAPAVDPPAEITVKGTRARLRPIPTADVARAVTEPRASEPPRTADGRPIIRHALPRPSVSLAAAPAARRSARPGLDERDTLAIPGERSGWTLWALLGVFAIVIALCWFELL